jgi:repressor LexA|nr:MAG TPA: LexA repressor [Bacteriophage sp.]
MTTGQRMKARRKELGLSAETVAEKLDISPATVYRYEKGDIDKIPGDILQPLASILHTTPAYLMGWEEAPAAGPAIPSGFIPVPEMEKVPLVGAIACGQPILAEENVEEMVDAPAGRGVDFCLICKGDSMIDAGIHDGDIVYIRQQPDVENGEIAAVRIGSEATLKRVYKSAAGVMLAPANAAYTPQMYGPDTLDDIQIEGKAVGWTHWI